MHRGEINSFNFHIEAYNFQLTASAGFNGHKQFTFTVLIVFRQSLFIAPLHLTKQINRAVFINDDSVKRPVMYILLFESQLQEVLGKLALVMKAESGASPEENARTVTLCG